MRYPPYGGKGSDPRFYYSETGRQNFDDIFRRPTTSVVSLSATDKAEVTEISNCQYGVTISNSCSAC